MAKIDFKGLDEYVSILKCLEKDIDGICKMAVYDGAAVLADAVKAEFNAQDHPYSDGNGLIDHMGLSKMENDAGYINTKLGFNGYLKDGRPAAVVARSIESGTSRQPKKPFIRPAVRKAKARCEQAMASQLEKQIEKHMK